MLRKLREISNPVSSTLADPISKVPFRRSMWKLDISTHHKPFAFELIEYGVDNCSPQAKGAQKQTQKYIIRR